MSGECRACQGCIGELAGTLGIQKPEGYRCHKGAFGGS